MLKNIFRGLAIVLLFTVRIYAQRDDTGLYAFGTFDSRGFDTINVGNLNAHFEIPVVSKQGRSGLNFVYSLVYDSLVWTHIYNYPDSYWIPAPDFGFHGQLQGAGAVTGSMFFSTQPYICPDGSMVTELYNYTYVDAGGVPHVFNLVQGAYCDDGSSGNSGDGSTSDGSGYRYVPPYVYKGQLQISPSTISEYSGGTFPAITDSNGNTISQNVSGTFTDTTGTTELTIAGQGTPNQPVTYTYPVAEQADGATQAVATSYYKAYTLQTNFGCSNISEYGPVSVNLIDHVVLADGSTYSFLYEPTLGIPGSTTGRLRSITLPTTGKITYEYSTTGGCGNGINGGGTPVSLQRITNSGTKTYTRDESAMRAYNPWIPCNGNSQAPWENFNACSANKVVDENNNETDYTFAEVEGADTMKLYETSRTVWNGLATAGQQLESTIKTYNGFNLAAFQSQPSASSFVVVPFSSILIADNLNGIPTANTLNTYDAAGSITSSSVWDPRQADPTNGDPYLQTTQWSYDPNETLASMTVTDGLGNQLYAMGYGFDQTPLIATSGIPQHNSATGYRGNRTSYSYWQVGYQNLGGKITNYDTGAVASSTALTPYTTPPTNPTGITTYTYDPTQTFTTGVTLPQPSSGVTIGTSAAYNTASGVSTSTTGANPGQTTTYNLYDRLLRPTLVTAADGGQGTATYLPTETISTLSMSAAQTRTQETFMDAYGRLVRSAIRADMPAGATAASVVWYLTDYCYDAAGRMQYRSTPYSSGSDNPSGYQCAVGTGDYYQYDGLSRKTYESRADGSVTSYIYNGKAVQSTTQAVSTVSRITQYDALGRVSVVCELSNSQLVNSGSPGPCWTDIPGTGFPTSYYYGAYGQLNLPAGGVPLPTVLVSQGSQERIFQTDGLGRPVYVQEPESGVTTYQYNYNASGLSQMVRTRPQANTPFYQTSMQLVPTTTTTTTYDGLGRVVGISYSDGTPPSYSDRTPAKTFSYDQASGGDAIQNKGSVIGQLAAEGTILNGSKISGREFAYDVMGRPNETEDCLPDWCGKAANNVYRWYGYDTASDLVSEQYATSGNGQNVATLSYGYNLAGQLTSVGGGQNNATLAPSLYSVQAFAPSGPTLAQFGNGLNDVYTYDAAGQMTGRFLCNGAIYAGCPGGAQVYAGTANMVAHQVGGMVDTAVGQGSVMSYDEFGRHTGMWQAFGPNTTSLSFNYDRYGNRYNQTLFNGSGPAPQLNFNPLNNQVIGYTYDFAGNVINDGIHQYGYDAENNLISIDFNLTATYVYDALNQRAKVTSGGVVTRYGFDLRGRRATTWQDGTGALAQAQYYAGGSRLGYWSQSDGNLHFNQQDWVGTERLEVSATGAVEGSSVSFPFGDNLTLSGTNTNEGHFAMMDHDLGAGSGLEHGTFREYQTTSGRWLSPDPYAGSYNFLNPQSLNRYVYALNNPLVFSDPLGLCDPQGIGQNFVGAKGNPRRADLGAEECTTAETPAGTTGTVTMTDSVTVTADPDPPDPIYNPGTDGVGWSLSGSVQDSGQSGSNAPGTEQKSPARQKCEQTAQAKAKATTDAIRASFWSDVILSAKVGATLAAAYGCVGGAVGGAVAGPPAAVAGCFIVGGASIPEGIAGGIASGAVFDAIRSYQAAATLKNDLAACAAL